MFWRSTDSWVFSLPQYAVQRAFDQPGKRRTLRLFLRVGVHDVPTDQIGGLEIPVDEVHPGVAGQSLARQ